MTIQTKITALLVGITLCFVAGLGLLRVFETGQTRGFLQTRAESAVAHFDKVLDLQASSVETFVGDYSIRDDMQQFMAFEGKGLIRYTIDLAMSSFHADVVWIYRQDCTLLYSINTLDDTGLRSLPVPCPLQDLFFDGGLSGHFFLRPPAGLLEVWWAPIQATIAGRRVGAPKGYLFAGRLWTEDYLRELATLTATRIRMTDTLNVQGPVVDLRRGIIRFGKSLPGCDGSPLVFLDVSSEWPFIRQFGRLSHVHIVLTFVFAAAVVVALSIFLIRWVTMPLRNISGALATEDTASLAALRRSQTEFGGIAGLIADFFRQKSDLVHEIEERKRAVEKSRESEERFRTVFDSATDGIYIADAETRTTLMCNRMFCTMTGYGMDEIRRLGVADFYPPYERPRILELFETQLRGENTQANDIPVLRKDGTVMYADIAASPMVLGARKYLVSIFRDITEHKLIQERLQQSQKMEAVGTLAGGVAHDFNNILAIISGNTELAKAQTRDDTPIRANLDKIYSACVRAKEMVRQILAFSRHTEMEKKQVRMTDVVRESVAMLRSTIPSFVEIRTDFSCQSDTVLADATQLHQVVVNLCTNAAHAMRTTGGTIDIDVSSFEIEEKDVCRYNNMSVGTYVKMSVRDTGSGISPQDIERIFEPFYTTKAQEEGTGLGLAVVHGIVKRHGGDIRAESVLGHGTTFTVFLPAVHDTIQWSEETSGAIPTGRGTVLVVDDEKLLAEMVQEILTKLGYDVTAVSSSREALEVFRRRPEAFDLLVTDQTMPHMTGEMLIREVRAVRADIPCILCTGYSDMINDERLAGLEKTKFIMKPYEIKDLATAVKKLIDAAGD